jgi:hypothetical protein
MVRLPLLVMRNDADGTQHEAAAPTQRGHKSRLARAGPLKPSRPRACSKTPTGGLSGLGLWLSLWVVHLISHVVILSDHDDMWWSLNLVRFSKVGRSLITM